MAKRFKRKFTAAEKKAFHMGCAFAAGKAGGRVKCPDEKTKQSFRNGVKSVRGKKPAQATCNNCGAPVVDYDDIIYQQTNNGSARLVCGSTGQVLCNIMTGNVVRKINGGKS